MKKVILVLLLAGIFVGCSKDNENPQPEESTGTVSLKFVKNSTLSGGQIVEEDYKMAFVMLWRAEGKEYVYNGHSDKNYAIDTKSNNPVKADFEYIDVRSKSVELLPGKYFIAILTDIDSSPRLAHSYTTFTVESNKVTSVKKNVSGMVSNKYNIW